MATTKGRNGNTRRTRRVITGTPHLRTNEQFHSIIDQKAVQQTPDPYPDSSENKQHTRKKAALSWLEHRSLQHLSPATVHDEACSLLRIEPHLSLNPDMYQYLTAVTRGSPRRAHLPTAGASAFRSLLRDKSTVIAAPPHHTIPHPPPHLHCLKCLLDTQCGFVYSMPPCLSPMTSALSTLQNDTTMHFMFHLYVPLRPSPN